MTVSLVPENDGKILYVQVSGKLTRDDYQNLTPQFEERISQHGKIRLLFEMVDFHGWNASALWEDLKIDFKHFNDIERLAIVGDKMWEKGMSVFCRPFTTAKIRYFEFNELPQAREWLSEDLVPVSTEPS